MKHRFSILLALILVTLLLSNTVTAYDLNPDASTDQESISLFNDPEIDRNIQEKIQTIFHNEEGLRDLSVEVNSGIVTIAGSSRSKLDERKAIDIASRVEGVISVHDEIQLDYTVQSRIDVIKEKLYQLRDVFINNLPLYVLALIVFLLFYAISSLVLRWSYIYSKITENKFLQNLVRQVVQFAVIFIGFVVSLEIIDATAILGTILGAAGILGLALGFAMRDTVENYIATVLLSIRQPFRPHDHIVLDGYEGKIMGLNTRETIMMTLDGNHVRIPNSIIYKGIILNYSRNPKRRFDFEIGVDTSLDLSDVQAAAKQALSETPGILDKPEPNCLVKMIGDSNVILVLFGWTDQEVYDYGKVKSEAIKRVKETFDQAGYQMPEPIYRLILENEYNSSNLNPQGEQSKIVEQRPAGGESQSLDVQKDTTIDSQIEEEATSIREDSIL